jgi:hypothetical protein
VSSAALVPVLDAAVVLKPSAEEYAVFSAVLTEVARSRARIDPIAVAPPPEQVHFWPRSDGGAPQPKRWGAPIAELLDDTYKDFLRQSPARISAQFTLPASIQIDIERIQPCIENAGPLQVVFSRVGFNRAGRQAVLSADLIAVNSSEFKVFVLEKGREGWRVVGSKTLEGWHDMCHI